MGQSSQRWAPQVLMQPEDFPNDRTYEAPRSADGETDAPAEETWKPETQPRFLAICATKSCFVAEAWRLPGARCS